MLSSNEKPLFLGKYCLFTIDANFGIVYMKKLVFFFTILVLIACNSTKKETQKEVEQSFNFSDAIVQDIYNLQNKRNAKGLIPFLSHEDPTYRYIAAMALASVQDTAEATSKATISALGRMLQNENEDESIRAMAAYALGQTYSPDVVQTLINAFEPNLKDAYYLVNAYILEAIGKCGSAKYLRLISTASYLPTDTLMLEGQAWGIYRYMLRGITAREGTNRMLDVLQNDKIATSVKRFAANYFGRANNIVFDSYKKEEMLLNAAQNEKDDYTRMALAQALGKLPASNNVLITLQDMFRAETDYRVKINILQSLSKYEYIDSKPIFLGALKDDSESVAGVASDYFKEQGKRADVDLYESFGQDSISDNWLVRANMLGAALNYISYRKRKQREAINEQLKANYEASKNPYEKGKLLAAMTGYALNYQYIYDETFKANQHPYVKTSGVAAMGTIRANPKLMAIVGMDYDMIINFFSNAFKKVFKEGDPAMMAVAAGILRTPKLGYKYVFGNRYEFLIKAQAGLQLPQDLEAHHEIQYTIDFFKNVPTQKLAQSRKTSKIDWKSISTLTPKTKAVVTTSKGTFEMVFYPMEAPSTVANFVKKATEGFYNGKAFHRVVPNHVAQTGCPLGNGYGSLDYSIRSELAPLKYDAEGWVGMASAGKDTECVQWFVAHSPRLHLDGKYTIFGKVIKGMKVVHRLALSDKIEKIAVVSDKQ